MYAKNLSAPLLFVLMAAVNGCTTVSPQHDFVQVAQQVAAATGQERIYQPEDDQAISDIVGRLLLDGLRANEAVEICLLNNPTLQAALMDVGIARAEVVQAGLFSNPFLGVSARFPDGGGLANIEASIAANIAEIWQLPARQLSAERSLDATLLDLSRSTAALAAKAKTYYYAAVGADQQLKIAQENLEITRNLLELALMRQQAGAANELDVNLSRGISLDAQIKVERVRLAAADARRDLALVLGLTLDAQTLRLTDPLPSKFPAALDASSLVSLAKVWRLDLRAAHEVVLELEARLELEYRMVWPLFELGVTAERSQRSRQGGRDVLADTVRSSISGGGLTAPDIQSRSQRRSGKGQDVIIGPSLGVEIPLFDQNQAQIAKAQYTLMQARKNLEAIDRAVMQEVRSAVDRAMTAWRLLQMYRDRSIPLAKGNIDLSRQAYRAGRASFLSVLEAQRFFLEARRGQVEASQTAATMIPNLERLIGLPFDRFEVEINKLQETTPLVEKKNNEK